MKTRMMLAGVLFALTLLLSFGLFTGEAAAQSGDQKIAMQEGLGTKEFDQSKMPGKLEMGLALGSAIAAVAAIKYL
ncbi:MAG: hypothetical protein H3C30_02475 [Candidatus Hydrogenedentes bacterium]|nr:hypothetical protein [Candidatus Hydrogenedentota bacterium]